MRLNGVPSYGLRVSHHRVTTPIAVQKTNHLSWTIRGSCQLGACRSLGTSQSLDGFLRWVAAQPEDLRLDRELVAAVHRLPGVPDRLSD
jgi:hypothetical protein